MTHAELIKRAAETKSIDLTGLLDFTWGCDCCVGQSCGLTLDHPMGDLVYVELFDLLEALDGKNVRLRIDVL